MTLQDDRLAISVGTLPGQVTRWGADEASAGDIPRGLQFGTSDPGGFKDAQLQLTRPVNARWPDLRLLENAKIYGRGGLTAWEGRLQETPSAAGAEESWSPGAVGWSAHLEDDPSFLEIYVDSDLQKWGEPSASRRRIQAEANQDMVPTGPLLASIVGGQLASGIFCNFSGFTHTNGRATLGEADYLGLIPIDYILYDYEQLTNLAEAAAWESTISLGIDDALQTSTVTGTNHKRTNTPLSQQKVTANRTDQTCARLRDMYEAAAATGVMSDKTLWANLTVVGRHKLPLHGTWPNVGVYGSEVIQHVLGRAAPLLNYTAQSIAATTFAIPHLVFTEGTTAAAVIEAVNAFHQYSWGVGDNRTFYFRPTTSYRKRWRVRRSGGDEIDLLGPQAEDAINGVVCSYTDPAGSTRVVGPPGTAGAYATSASLVDTSVENPVNLAGIPRKWARIDLSFVTTAEGAIQVAAAYLAIRKTLAASRGSVKAYGLVEDEHGALYPVWAMRAGDSCTWMDGDGIERPIISTNYDHDSRLNTCDCDATPHRWEAMNERMGVVLVGIAD